MLSLIFFAVVTGCTTNTSVGPYNAAAIGADKALVLVAVASSVPLAAARACHINCTESFILGGREDVYAYPYPIGSNFQLERVLTMDNRIASVASKPLKLEKRGIYYYGAIVADGSRVFIADKPNDYMLLRARRKYEQQLSGLQPVNFVWPATGAETITSSYTLSAVAQATLKRLRTAGAKPMHVNALAAPIFDPVCRGGLPLTLPDYVSYEAYVRQALNDELRAAGLYSDAPTAIALGGSLNHLEYSTVSGWWKIQVTLTGLGGKTAMAEVQHNFSAGYAAAGACVAAEQAVPPTVQQLIDTLVAQPQFSALAK